MTNPILPPLLGITGPKHAGKSTLARAIAAHLRGAVILELAAPIKRGLAATLDITGWSCHELKELPLADSAPECATASCPTRRAWMQAFGDFLRERHPDILPRLAARTIRQHHRTAVAVIFEDVRLPAEAAWIRAAGGNIVHVSRPSVTFTHEHATEAGIPPADTDDHAPAVDLDAVHAHAERLAAILARQAAQF